MITINSPVYSGDEVGTLDVEVQSLRIVESVLSTDSYESTPVPGGQCFDVTFFGRHVFQDDFEQ